MKSKLKLAIAALVLFALPAFAGEKAGYMYISVDPTTREISIKNPTSVDVNMKVITPGQTYVFFIKSGETKGLGLYRPVSTYLNTNYLYMGCVAPAVAQPKPGISPDFNCVP